MKTHELIQGTPEWMAYRAAHDNASDAPAMMGESSYKTRDQLIAEVATGIVPEVDAATQRLFNSGHRFEELARPRAEALIGQDLYPCTGSLEGSRLSASFDGLTMLEDLAFEHKRLNQRLRAAFADMETLAPAYRERESGRCLPLEYQIQMEQQCAVSGCEKVLFMATHWGDDDALLEQLQCWYFPNLELRARIVAGWDQFHKEVAAYVVPDSAPVKVVAEAVTALPAVFAQVTGSIALKDNLPEYEVALRDFIDNRLISKPETDQDFANLDLQIKALKGAEAALDASEKQALSQAEMLSAFKRQKDMLHKLTRDTRLAAEKMLTAEKERIKLEQVQRGQKEFVAHIAGLNTRLGKPYMPTVHSDFAGAIKGKRTVDSLRDAVNTELARAKIAANEIADRIQLNLTSLREMATAHAFLFADAPQLVMKANDDLLVLIKSRIGEHEAKEAARLEAERERIRAEEQAKAQREAQAAEAQRERERQEEQRQQELQKARDDQAAIAAAAASQQLAAPVAEDLSNLVREKAQEAVAGIDAAQAISTAQLAASVAPVARTGAPTLSIGTIKERLEHMTVTAENLRALGFEPAGRERSAPLYHDDDFPAICDAIAKQAMAAKAQFLRDLAVVAI